MQDVRILGISVHRVRFAEAVQIVMSWLRGGTEEAKYVVTPNINHVVLYQDNDAFREAYENAALVLADGRYVVWLSRLFGNPLPEPVNGSDLIPSVLEAASASGGLRVFLLGAMPGIANTAAARITSRWPSVTVTGTYSPPGGFESDEAETDRIVALINKAAPDLLVVGISPPKQEIWVGRTAARLRVRVIICAGATIDFLAGEKARAPGWMQRAGLEWVFRMVMEPKRLVPRYTRDGVAVLKLVWSQMLRPRRR